MITVTIKITDTLSILWNNLLISSSEWYSYDRGIQQFPLTIAAHHQHPASIRRHTITTEQHRFLWVQQNVVSLGPYQGTNGAQGGLTGKDEWWGIYMSVRVYLSNNRDGDIKERNGHGRHSASPDYPNFDYLDPFFIWNYCFSNQCTPPITLDPLYGSLCYSVYIVATSIEQKHKLPLQFKSFAWDILLSRCSVFVITSLHLSGLIHLSKHDKDFFGNKVFRGSTATIAVPQQWPHPHPHPPGCAVDDQQ